MEETMKKLFISKSPLEVAKEIIETSPIREIDRQPEEKEYFLGRDEDCHWYIIPVDMLEQWENFLYEVYELENYDIEPPEGVKQIDSYSNVQFTNFRII